MVGATRAVGRVAIIAVVGVVSNGCSKESRRSESGVVKRDSAGIAIVEHSAAAMQALPVWTLGEPIDRITGEADTGFTDIGTAVRRSDGQYLINDRRRADIRRYAANGALEQVVARRGAGPGELAFLSTLQLLALDSIAYSDANQRRFTIAAPDGRFVRQVAFPQLSNGTLVRLLVRFDDGRFVGPLRPTVNEDTIPRDRAFRDSLVVVAARTLDDGSLDALDTLARLPGLESYFATTTENGETRPDIYPIRFGLNTVVGYHRNGFVYATNDTPEWRAHSGRGLSRIVRFAEAPLPFTQADRARFLMEVDSNLVKSGMPPSLRAEWHKNAQTWRFSKNFMPVDRLIYGSDGSVWLERPSLLTSDPVRYVVFDSTGQARARLTLPSPIRAMRVSLTEIIGSTKTDDDVPVLMRWRIKTP